MPSGLFESSRHNPVGSGADVCLAAPMALSKMSFQALHTSYIASASTQNQDTVPRQARWSRTLTRTTDANFECACDEKTLVFVFPKICEAQAPPWPSYPPP